eukprot:3067670-Rhodomonas_salina.1
MVHAGRRGRTGGGREGVSRCFVSVAFLVCWLGVQPNEGATDPVATVHNPRVPTASSAGLSWRLTVARSVRPHHTRRRTQGCDWDRCRSPARSSRARKQRRAAAARRSRAEARRRGANELAALGCLLAVPPDPDALHSRLTSSTPRLTNTPVFPLSLPPSRLLSSFAPRPLLLTPSLPLRIIPRSLPPSLGSFLLGSFLLDSRASLPRNPLALLARSSQRFAPRSSHRGLSVFLSEPPSPPLAEAGGPRVIVMSVH